MFFINVLLVLHNVSFQLIDSIYQKLTISLYLKDEYNKNSVEVIDMLNDIRTFSRDINILYKTKQEVLEDIRVRDPELVNILERTNPLPETIVLSGITIDQFEDVNHIIENKLYILSADQKGKQKYGYTSQYERIRKVTTMLKTLQF
jgi:cell division transport system permease protein